MHTEARKDGCCGYCRLIKSRTLTLLFLAGLLLLFLALSLSIGSYRLSPVQILAGISGSPDPLVSHLLWEIRLPRAVGACLAGAGLALSGITLQTLLRNPLAAPSTLGISQGAAFGATCAIILLDAGRAFNTGSEAVLLTNRSITAVCAFAGALAALGAITAIASLRRLSSEAVILAGVAVSAFFSACTMLVQYFAGDMQVAATLFWTFGDPGKAGWTENSVMALILVPAFSYLLFRSWCLNSLHWGDDTARSLGVHTTRLRLTALVLTCLLTAIITSFLGIIAFVGLMAPHLVRPLIGSDHRFLLPAATIGGALLLLAADIIARIVLSPVVIPVGIITSFAGAPLLLFLLLRRTSP